MPIESGFDSDGRVVNGKRPARIHELRCTFDERIKEINLRENNGALSETFQLNAPASIKKWLGDFFRFPVNLRHEPQKGFPDDHTAFGPTITSEASLV